MGTPPVAGSGKWLEEALVQLCERVGSGLDLDRDVISGLVSYCELAHPLDAKEYLDNIIGQEAGKSIIEEYLGLRGGIASVAPVQNQSNFVAYVKPAAVASVDNVNRKAHASRENFHGESNKKTSSKFHDSKKPEANDPNLRGNQVNSKKKKGGRVVSLAEAAKGSIVFQQGKPCSCQARRHRLVSNCLSCGKIVCEQEGEGPCHFCGVLVLKDGSKYAGLEDDIAPVSKPESDAKAYAKRLVEYDRNSAARTTVIDDQSDYYEIDGNNWLSNEEKELLRKRQEALEEAERAKRGRVVVTFDLVGRKVLMSQDEEAELESTNRILRPPDVRETNRIQQNPSLRIQPVFVDPGPNRQNMTSKQSSKSRTTATGLCLEITGRVQHDNSDLKHISAATVVDSSRDNDQWKSSLVNDVHDQHLVECPLE